MAQTANARDVNKQWIADSIDVVLEVKLGLAGYLYMLVGEADREMS